MKSKFDEKVKEWDTPARVERAEKSAKYILERMNIDKSMKIFELGTGTGIIAIILSEYAGEITAGDNSKGMLEALKNKLEKENITNIKYFYFDIEREDVQTDDYDMAVSAMVLHHIEDINDTAQKIYKMLKKGGKIALIDLLKENGDFHKDNEGVKHFGFEKGEIENIFKKAGFENVKVDEFDYVLKKNRYGELKKFPLFFLYGEK